MYVDRTGKIPPSVTKHKHSKLSTVHTQYVEDQDHELFVRRPMGARCWMLGVIQGPEIVQLAIQNPPSLVDCAQITVDAGWKVVFLRTWTVYRQCPYYLVSFHEAQCGVGSDKKNSQQLLRRTERANWLIEHRLSVLFCRFLFWRSGPHIYCKQRAHTPIANSDINTHSRQCKQTFCHHNYLIFYLNLN